MKELLIIMKALREFPPNCPLTAGKLLQILEIEFDKQMKEDLTTKNK